MNMKQYIMRHWLLLSLSAIGAIGLNLWIWLAWAPILAGDREERTVFLYLFSSMVQAEAAILGFGAIFVIFKLQSLQSSIELSLSMTGYKSQALTLLESTSNWKRARVLSERHDNRTMTNIVSARCRIEAVRKELTPVLVIMGLGLSVCTLCLWQTTNLTSPAHLKVAVMLGLTLFLVGVLWSLQLAYSLVIEPDKIPVPQVIQILCDAIDKEKPLHESYGGANTPAQNITACQKLVHHWTSVIVHLGGLLDKEDVDMITRERVEPWQEKLSRFAEQ
jgi:hypothetical protein